MICLTTGTVSLPIASRASLAARGSRRQQGLLFPPVAAWSSAEPPVPRASVRSAGLPVQFGETPAVRGRMEVQTGKKAVRWARVPTEGAPDESQSAICHRTPERQAAAHSSSSAQQPARRR